MKIILPNNGLGYSVFITVILLILVIPFVTVLWAFNLVTAPLWVTIPFGLLASVIAFVTLVKFKP